VTGVSKGLVAVLVVGSLGLAGVAYAAIPGPDGVIHGCYQTIKGSLRVIDSSASCSAGETPLTWNQTGPQGVQGIQGPAGPAGPSHAYTGSTSFVGTLPYGPSVFPQSVVSVTVPAGDYVVYATGTFDVGDGSPAELICSIGDNPPVTGWTAPSDGEAPYSLVGTDSLPSGGTIDLECMGGDQQTITPSMADNELVAVRVGGID